MATATQTPQVSFHEKSHTYFLDGKPVPLSVTKIFEILGITDYSDILAWVLDHKRLLGEVVHADCEAYDKGIIVWDTIHPEALPYVEAWCEFCHKVNFKSHLIEHRGVGVLGGMPCGYTLDRAGWIKDEPYILELKCAATAENWWPIQLSGYKFFAPRLPGQGIAYKIAAVQLCPDGKYRLHTTAPDGTDYQDRRYPELFRSMLHAASWKLMQAA